MHDHACIFITTDLCDVASDDGEVIGVTIPKWSFFSGWGIYCI